MKLSKVYASTAAFADAAQKMPDGAVAILVLGPSAASPTCTTAVPAFRGKTSGRDAGNAPDPKLRIFVKAKEQRLHGKGPSNPGYLAAADPMVQVAEDAWGCLLVLPEQIEYTAFLMGGIDQCRPYLDDKLNQQAYSHFCGGASGETDATNIALRARSSSPTARILDQCRMATGIAPDFEPSQLARFDIVGKFAGAGNQPTATNGKTAACDYSRLQGAWVVEGKWHSPGCTFDAHGAAAAAAAESSVPTPSNEKRAICLVGDLHFREMLPTMKAQLSVENADGPGPGWNAFVYHENSIRDVCSDKYIPNPNDDAIYFGKVKECLEYADVVLVSFGSRAPGRSAAEMEDAARNLTALVDAAHASPSSAKPCVLVAATADAKHESIPEKVHPAQRYFRSTYREAMRNEAVRAVVEPHPFVHFVDVFRPSAALHWDGHPYEDPVHFYNYMPFYEQTATILRAALHAKCHIMPTRATGAPKDMHI